MSYELVDSDGDFLGTNQVNGLWSWGQLLEASSKARSGDNCFMGREPLDSKRANGSSI